MNRTADLTGMHFGRWKAIERAEDDVKKDGKHATQWLCECKCGTQRVVLASSLIRGISVSCGCLRKERQIAAVTIHGKYKTRLYSIWLNIKSRCNYENAPNFLHYGARGIRICDEWKDSFEAFEKWSLSNGYADNLSIDRIDVNGNYEPSNCRWVDIETQSRNKTNNVLIEYNGEVKVVSDWARIFGIPECTLSHRLLRGIPFEKAIKMSTRKLYPLNNGRYNISQLSRITGIPRRTLSNRLNSGWSLDDALYKPLRKKVVNE